MVTTADRRKRYVHISILLALVLCLVSPAYAGTIRHDFDDIRPHEVQQLSRAKKIGIGNWMVHRICDGIGPPGPAFIIFEDGLLKIMDGHCGMVSLTGIYRPESWTDYEVRTRIKVRNFGNVNLLVRAVQDRLGMSFSGNSYRISPVNPVDVRKWYSVRIVAEGDRVTFFLAGKKVSEQAASRASGGVAFVTTGAEFWLDYIEIIGDDILPVEPQGRLITCWAKLKQS